MIRIEVQGNDICQNGKNCGVCGEGNSTEMLIAFSEEWKEYAKKVVFYDARGENPVIVLLTGTNKEPEEEIYRLKIPSEPLKFEGDIEYVIDGTVEGARKKSVGGKLRVRYAPDSTSEDIPEEVAQSVAEQLQEEAVRIGDMAINAVPYIGDNGNWFKYDPEQKLYVDTGVYATGPEGPQGVQGKKGDKGDKGETGAIGATGAKGEKGEKGEKGDTGDKGVDGIDGKDGYSPVRGKDYWTDSDKQEIQSEIKLPILKSVYGPNTVTIGQDGFYYSEAPNSTEIYNHYMADALDMEFLFPLGKDAMRLLGKNATYSLVINEIEVDPVFLQSGCIGLAFVKFEDPYDETAVSSFATVETNYIVQIGAYTYSTVLPEDIPDGYEDGEIAIYVKLSFSEYVGGNVSVSIPKMSIDDENFGVWFLWDVITRQYINSGVSAKGPQGVQGMQGENGYTPQRGIDYWTEADKAEINSYIDNSSPLIIDVWDDGNGNIVSDVSDVNSIMYIALLDGRPIIVYEWDSSFKIYVINAYVMTRGELGHYLFSSSKGDKLVELCYDGLEDVWKKTERIISTEDYVDRRLEELILGGAW